MITAWDWDLGNGTSASGQVVDAVYDTSGTYTASLTVTDDQGGSHTESVKITVTSGYETGMHVSNIAMDLGQAGANTFAQAIITVTDEAELPVANATISGTWTGLSSGAVSGTTDPSGRAVLGSGKTKKNGTFTFTVDSITCPGYVHTPEDDLISWSSIDTP